MGNLLIGIISAVFVLVAVFVVYLMWAAYGDLVSPWHVGEAVKILIGLAVGWFSICALATAGWLSFLLYHVDQL